MLRPARPAPALVIAALAIFSVWITWRAKALEIGASGGVSNTALLNKPAPEIKLPALDGSAVSLSAYRGRNVVLAFWASWCGPCRIEMPALRELYHATHTPDADYEILAISINEPAEDARAAASQLHMPFPVLVDREGVAANAYGVNAIPTLFVIDKKGVVQFAHTGYDMGMEVLLPTQLGIKNYVPGGKK